MNVNLQSILFKRDPAKRFGKHLNCIEEVWRKIWYRYKFLGYSREEAREYLIAIYKIPMNEKQFNRWISRTEIYLKAQPAIKVGVKQVNSSYFGKYKTMVERETHKNTKKTC